MRASTLMFHTSLVLLTGQTSLVVLSGQVGYGYTVCLSYLLGWLPSHPGATPEESQTSRVVRLLSSHLVGSAMTSSCSSVTITC